MKITAGAVFAAVETIKLLDESKVKFPFKGRVGLAQIKAHLSVPHGEVAKERDGLIVKHGVEMSGRPVVATHIEVEVDGEKTTVPNPAYANFVLDLNAVLLVEIEVDCPRVKLTDLGDRETDVDLVALLPFIDGDPDEKTAPAT